MLHFTTKFTNLNSDRRLSPNTTIAKAYPELSPVVRIKKICETELLNIADDEIVFLLELDTFMLQELSKFAHTSGFEYTSVTYNYSLGAFACLIITKIKNIVNSLQIFPLTKSGKFVENCDRPTRDSESDYLSYTEEVLGDNFEKLLIKITYDNIDIYCTHVGLSNNCKLNQTKMICDIIKKESVDNNKSFILGGDFNMFDQTQSEFTLYVDQLNVITKNLPVVWSTKNIENTFTPFPYDIVFKMTREEKDIYFQLNNEGKVEEFRNFCSNMVEKYGLFGGALDHVFHTDGMNIVTTAIDFGDCSDHFVLKCVCRFFY